MEFTLSVPVTHVLHIGAGCGVDVEGYTTAGLDPVVLVDADPEVVTHLQTRTGGLSAVRVVQAAVSTRKDAQLLFRTNFSELNSLSRPDQLRELFPGLTILAEEPVELVSPLQLLDELQFPQDGVGLLVLEAPGETTGILAALAEAGRLTQFPVIRIQEGGELLHDCASGLAAICVQLRAFGYDTWVEGDAADPDRPHVVAYRGSAGAHAEKRLDELEAAASAQSEALAEATSARDSARSEAEGLAARVAELEVAAAAQSEALAEATSARDDARSEAEGLAVRVAELESAASAQSEALAEATSARDDARSEAEGLAVRVAELEAAASAQSEALAEATSARDGARSEAEGLAARVAELEAAASAQSEALAEATSARDDARSEAEGLAARVAELEAENERQAQELEHRTKVSQTGLRRAEGQIELIKDLLLRGETL